jgi:hypothetical protein
VSLGSHIAPRSMLCTHDNGGRRISSSVCMSTISSSQGHERRTSTLSSKRWRLNSK